jgi:methanogenic corrinoid protein MtbC1
MSYYLDLEEAVLNGQEEEAVLLVQKLIDDKPDPTQIKKSMSDGIIRASENWTQGSYSSANILLAIDAYREVREILNRANLLADDKPLGRIIIATVAGNVHIIGKALIGALLEATGFEVIDLGENVTRDMFKEKIKELKPDILALGCYTLDAQHELKKLLSEIDMAGLRSNLRVIIGGHSTSQALADQVGADAWASNLPDTIEKAKNVIPKN